MIRHISIGGETFITSNISVKYITSVRFKPASRKTIPSLNTNLYGGKTNLGRDLALLSTSAKKIFEIFHFLKFNYPSPRRQNWCSRSWRNLQLNPRAIFETFWKSVSTSFFTSFFREVPKGITTRYRRIYATVEHTGALTKILPISTAARLLWWDMA
jgi:hypothetical protein